ncbi:Nmad5 family putative nucleotide modification protein [Brevundimonas sp.]|uniref:Nmad5 family putative nucleotide modification protein n=1 Tax=Brevundimonas sp. TaxID=1871086 RepID=UPI002D74798D|nr:Nmad5 family putative nucleotide modification protein [Brevundimonas sp.]HYC66679.1 Nmad5 family putative nucleotide modification protein [Brevundimonas sp.]
MKTRLTNADREAIRAALIDHKFKPIFADLDREENALAIKVRARAYGDFLSVIDNAPEGAFPSTGKVTVAVGGKSYGVTFSGAARVFYQHDRGWSSRILEMKSGDKLGEQIEDHANRLETAKDERNHLRRTLDATLKEFRTFDDLLAGWPEAEAFITERWRSRPEYAANVPAVAIKTLTESLDLPPETVAEAA